MDDHEQREVEHNEPGASAAGCEARCGSDLADNTDRRLLTDWIEACFKAGRLRSKQRRELFKRVPLVRTVEDARRLEVEIEAADAVTVERVRRMPDDEYRNVVAHFDSYTSAVVVKARACSRPTRGGRTVRSGRRSTSRRTAGSRAGPSEPSDEPPLGHFRPEQGPSAVAQAFERALEVAR